MVVDSSALMAVIQREPEEQSFRNAIKSASARLLGAGSRIETSIVVLNRRGEAGLEQLHALIASLKLDIVPLSDDQARIAIEAFRRFGKGRHRASLNFGDCLSYALAKATGQPLLFKGGDFAQTDIRSALESP